MQRQEAPCQVVPHEEFVTADTPLEGIIISGVDSMRSRQAIWDAVQNHAHEVPLLLDGRIGGENLQLLSVQPSDLDVADEYEAGWLFSDDVAAPLPCAARTVIHPPTVLAGLIIAQLTLFLREEPFKFNIMSNLKSMQFAV